jgi:mannose-1-phosphate guanylyltransferase
LHHTISLLKGAGLRDITFSSGGRNGDIRLYFGDGEQQGLRFRYMPAGRFNGSVDVVNGWLNQVGSDAPETLIVIYGDSLLRMDFVEFVRRHRASGADVSILAHRARFESFLFSDDPCRTNYGVMDVATSDDIVGFEEKPLLADIPKFRNPWANGAVYAFNRWAIERIRRAKEPDFGRQFFPALLNEHRHIRAVDIEDGYRLDVGTLELYLTSQMSALRGILPCDPGFRQVSRHAWCDDSADVGRRTEWPSPAIVGPVARVASTARLDHAIVCEGAVIGEGALIESSVILDRAHIGRNAVIRRSVIGFGCQVGDGAPALEDAVLGERSVVQARCLLMGDHDFRGLLGQNA